MEHAARPADERLHLGNRVVPRGALVDDAVQSKFGGDFHLLPENFRLLLFAACVVSSGKFRFLARQMVIVQTRFADGDDFWMSCKFAQGGAQIARRFFRLGRMPADDGKDVWKFFSEADCAFAAGPSLCRWK